MTISASDRLGVASKLAVKVPRLRREREVRPTCRCSADDDATEGLRQAGRAQGVARQVGNRPGDPRHRQRRCVLPARNRIVELQGVGARAARVGRRPAVVERQRRRTTDRHRLAHVERQRQRLAGTVIARWCRYR